MDRGSRVEGVEAANEQLGPSKGGVYGEKPEADERDERAAEKHVRLSQFGVGAGNVRLGAGRDLKHGVCTQRTNIDSFTIREGFTPSGEVLLDVIPAPPMPQLDWSAL